MEHSVTPLSSAQGEGEASRVGDHSNHVDAEADVEAKAYKQRRKVQNRKNQRAHRLRIKEQDAGSVRMPRAFHIRRWRLDEPDECPPQDASSASKGAGTTYISPRVPHTHVGTSILNPEPVEVLRRLPPPAPVYAQTSQTSPSIIFPLSTDHLLHLVQYNVFRAFASNKRTLNTFLTGRTDNCPSPIQCPMSDPHYDVTTVYPVNPNIPLSLVPTSLQQTRLHSFWINLVPLPRVRDNLIRYEASFDLLELLQDLIGEFINATPARERRGTPLAVSDPKSMWTLPLTSGRDEDEVTAGRKGLIVWGEPHDMRSWEVTPGFLAKWPWAVEGCNDLIESSNRWRLMRGEEPIRLFESKR